ncbi:hypothetical protein AYO44_06420 [Planctomycetaceae bacterium SCGC AG-212-F19]|nr:hypothetical protein AYO44_06420 [Planctomycetaceae bacterium SCGC AG-212-F19]
MPATIDSPAALLDELRRHQLLSSHQLREVDGSRFADARALAQGLMQRGWLTAFQINQLLQGRGASLVLGPYVLLERLGEGATGQVFKARHLRLNRLAAVKVIRPELLTQPDAVQRFYREVQVTGRLAHPNIVEAYDAGPAGSSHFLAMAFIAGTDLDRLVKQHGPLAIRQACEYTRQAACGLAHAHERGLVHRDIKPSNLMVCQAHGPPSVGVLKILDLGLVHMSRDLAATMTGSLTENGTMLGTPDFMAPEQAENTHRVDHRADIYSLGGTLYYLLTSQVPFPNCSLMQKLLKLQTTEPVAVELLRPEVSPALADLVRRMMAKRPEDRPATAAEVMVELSSFADGSLAPSPVSTPTKKLPKVKSPPAGATGANGRKGVPTCGDLSLSTTLLRLPPLTRRFLTWPRLRVGKHWRLLLAGWLVVLLAVIVVGLMKLGTTADASEWQKIEVLRKDPHADRDALRQQVLAFRMRHPDSPLAARASDLLRDLPSPLDVLNPGQLPAEEQRPGLPRDVVAILGKHQLPAVTPRNVAMCADPPLVASLGGSGTVFQITDLITGETRASWNLPAGIHAAALAPPGQLAATVGADQVIRLWDVPPGKERATLAGHTRTVTGLAFAGDRVLASCDAENNIKIWDVPAAREKTTFTSPAAIRALGFAPDGQTLATIGSDRVIRLWEVAAGKVRATVTLPSTATMIAIAFSPDSKLLAIGTGDNTLRLWNIAGAKEGVTLKGHTQPVHVIAFSPDGATVATSSYDRTIRLWDAATGKETGKVSAHPTLPLMFLVFAPDGRTITAAASDQTVMQWDGRGPVQVIRGHPEWRTAVALAPDDRTIATGSRGGLVCLWDPATREIRTSFHAHTLAITALAYTPDGKVLVTSSADRTARLWDAATGKPLATLAGHQNHVLSMTVSPDGHALATGSADQTVKLWGLDGKERRSLRGHAQPVLALTFTPDGRTIVTGGADGALRAWDATTGALHSTFPGGTGRVTALAAAGPWLTAAAQDPALRLWTGSTGKFQSRTTLTAHTAPAKALAFRLDGKVLASGAEDGRVLLWTVADARKDREWLLPGPAESLHFAGDGRHLAAVAGNGVVYLLRLPPESSASAPIVRDQQ